VLAAFAGTGVAATDLVDTAQVVSSTPIVERVTEPRQECVPVAAAPVPRERSLAGPIVGGVAGALLGNQVGRGNGRTAATAAGAVVGTIVGDRVGNPETGPAGPAQQCRTVETTRDVVKGYTVVYRYYNRDITTTLPYNPGPTVRVGVGIVDNAPLAGGAAPARMGPRGRNAPPAPAPVYEAPPPVSSAGGYPY
jgi:uncharacterized protein YcfJ